MTAVAHPRTERGTPALNIALWVAQVLLAAGFAMGGFMKLTAPIDALHAQMAWATAVPDLMIRFIGASELAGAVGLILPALTRIQPRLTGLAALGLLTIMVLALLFHVVRAEWSYLPVNALLGGLAGFVAWGRLIRAPIASRARAGSLPE